jgi:hypothetical protein
VEVLQRVEQNTRAMQEGLRELRQGVDTPNRSEKKNVFLGTQKSKHFPRLGKGKLLLFQDLQISLCLILHNIKKGKLRHPAE